MSESKSFWTTLPGILTAIAALIGAIVGLLNAFHSLGWLESNTRPTPIPTVTPIIRVSPADTIKLINQTLQSNSPEKALPLLDDLVESDIEDDIKDDVCKHVFQYCIVNKRLEVAKEVIDKFKSAAYQEEAAAIYEKEVYKQSTTTK